MIHSARCEIADLLYTDKRAERQLPVEFVHHDHALDLQKSPRFDITGKLRYLIIMYKHLYCNRIRKVRNIKNQNRALILDLTLIKGYDLTPDRDLTDLSLNLLYFQRLILKISTIEHIRIIGTFQRLQLIIILLICLLPFRCIRIFLFA